MNSEWTGRLDHWLNTLTKDFYRPLGAIEFSMHATFQHLTPQQAAGEHFAPVSLGHTFGVQWQYAWLRADIVLPAAARNQMIVLDLKPGGETTIFLDGQPFGTYRAGWVRVPHHFLQDNILCQSGQEGRHFSLLCEVYAGHHVPKGNLIKWATGPVLGGQLETPPEDETRCTLGASTFGIWNEAAYQLWMDATALREVMDAEPGGSLRRAKISEGLQSFTLAVDFEQPPADRDAQYLRAREILRPLLACHNGSTAPIFYAVGNAHLDVVWLWPYAETVRKTARTFAAQLRLIEQYPGYKFLQSQPQTYEMCRLHYPQLFKAVQAAVKKGGWIAEGGMWVEPDTNMSGGEALIRQLLYGLRYFKQYFGVDCEILWLPDTFGYSAALPQILRGCGIKYLVTQKIFWSYNESDPFPYHYFTWQGNDGSRVTSYLPTSYTYTTNPGKLREVWENRVQKDGMDKFLLPFGYGDGGGGPSRDYLEFCRREEDLEGCPRMVMESPNRLFLDLEADGGPQHTYVGELYFTAHRGVFTSQAGVKQGNRRAEASLREAEFWGALAQTQGHAWPAEAMEAAWKKVLLNQFHDILPGSSIERVYREAAVLHAEAIQTAGAVAAAAAGALCDGTPGNDGGSLTVFNSLSWARIAPVYLPARFAAGAVDADGRAIPTARQADGCLAMVPLPACGTACLRPTGGENPPLPAERAARAKAADGLYILENAHIRAAFGTEGELLSFILRETGREMLCGAANRFLLYRDTPRTFDAWDIDSPYELEFVESGHNAGIRMLESGPLAASLEITKDIGVSHIRQTVRLFAHSRRLEFDTTVDWNELHRLLKVDFPADVHAEEGLNEIQFGYVAHPTHRSRAYEKDRFEVCNHRYTALCDASHGAAVLNDCKYGVSMLDNAIKLTLLRAAGSPHFRADNGTHRFTYAFTAWEGGFFESDVVQQGYELNCPPLVLDQACAQKSFFDIDAQNVILETVKPAEDGSGDIILRMYEAQKGDTRTALHCALPLRQAMLCTMLEAPLENGALGVSGGHIPLQFRPFEVKTVRLCLA